MQTTAREVSRRPESVRYSFSHEIKFSRIAGSGPFGSTFISGPGGIVREVLSSNVYVSWSPLKYNVMLFSESSMVVVSYLMYQLLTSPAMQDKLQTLKCCLRVANMTHLRGCSCRTYFTAACLAVSSVAIDVAI